MFPYFKVSEIKLDLDDSFLLSKEKEEFLKFKLAKRKIEWLNARYIAKKLISEKIKSNFDEILIFNDKNRIPFASVKEKNFRISISHRGDLCGCAFNSNFSPYIGIDIEKIEEKENIWIEDFFDEEEKKRNLIELIKLWTLKEAILKMLGLGLSVNIKEIKFKNDKIVFLGELKKRFECLESKLKYKIYKEKNYFIALSWV